VWIADRKEDVGGGTSKRAEEGSEGSAADVERGCGISFRRCRRDAAVSVNVAAVCGFPDATVRAEIFFDGGDHRSQQAAVFGAGGCLKFKLFVQLL